MAHYPQCLQVGNLRKKRTSKIAIVGLGNLLLADEGFGVHLVRFLKENYEFSNVDVLDGGTTGFQLIEHFMIYENLIFVDALRVNDKPGSVYRFPLSEVPPNITFVSSVHEIGLGDILGHVKLMGMEKNAIVVGIVPYAVTPNDLTVKLTDKIKNLLPKVADIVLNEAMRMGGVYARRGNS